MVKLSPDIQDSSYSERALERGVVVPALSSYFHDRPTLNGFVVGFAAADTESASQALAILGNLLD